MDEVITKFIESSLDGSKLEKQICEHFGLEYHSLELYTNQYWKLDDGGVYTGESVDQVGVFYNEYYQCRGFGKWVYESDNFTVVVVNDGYRNPEYWLLDNSLRIKEL